MCGSFGWTGYPADFDRPDAGTVAEDPQLERAVDQLSRRQRQVILLHYLADLSVGDVARVLGLSEGSVKTHLHRARSALRELIGDDRER